MLKSIFSATDLNVNCSTTYVRDNDTLIVDCVSLSGQTIESVTYSVDGGDLQFGETTCMHRLITAPNDLFLHSV